MKNSMFFVLVLNAVIIALPIAAAAQYKVVRGERPPVDLNQVRPDDIVSGVLKIKLADHVSKDFSDLSLSYDAQGIPMIGVASVDHLNRLHRAKEIIQDYSVISAQSRYTDRHIAWGFHLWYTIRFDESTDIINLVGQFESLPEVAIAEPEYRKSLIGNAPPRDVPVPENFNPAEPAAFWTPDDPRYNEQWHYHNTGQQNGTPDADIDLPEAWDIEKGDPEVIIAIIDEGIQFTHVDLAANMWEGIGFNFQNNTPNINPGNHGTHVGGTISAVNNNTVGVSGIAGGSSAAGNGVRLMSCQVFSGFSSGGFAQAPVWAADNGAAISQNSWGYTSQGNYNQDVLDAIDYFNANGGGDAILDGGLTIFAAGNSNSDGAWYPGYYSATMAVAGTNNQDKKAWYSNFGAWVDISAPGGETNQSNPRGVLSTLNGNTYGFYEGTSMACPHVSGVAALIISRNYGTMTRQEVWDALVNTTDDHYGVNPGFIGKLGSGRLNAFNALNSLKDIEDPTNLTAVVDQDNGTTVLNWNHNQGSGFEYYKVYLDGVHLDNTVSKTFQHVLAEYGYFTFSVTAYYGGADESNPVVKDVQYGSSTLVLSQNEINSELHIGQSETQEFKIWNTGVLPLEYILSTFGFVNPEEEWFTYEPASGTVEVGDSAVVLLTFNAGALEIGTYTKNFIVRSNDINNSVKSLPVTLNITERQPMQVTVEMSDGEICVGESVSFLAEAVDGTGEYSFLWSADPPDPSLAGQETLPNPVVSPEVTTMYTITVTDGEDEYFEDLTVMVYPYPLVALTAAQEFCGEQAVVLDAGSEGFSYLWSTGETTQTINVSQATSGYGMHEFWVLVSGPIGCSASDSTSVSYYEFPPVAQLGPDTLLCGNENWHLTPDVTNFGLLWSNGSTEPTITVDTLGFGYGMQTYWVDLISAEGCVTRSEEVRIEFLDCTGLTDDENSIGISAFPNPTDGIIELNVAGTTGSIAQLEVLHASGQKVMATQVNVGNKIRIDLTDKPKGVYTIIIHQDNNIGTMKVVLK